MPTDIKRVSGDQLNEQYDLCFFCPFCDLAKVKKDLQCRSSPPGQDALQMPSQNPFSDKDLPIVFAQPLLKWGKKETDWFGLFNQNANN